MDEFELYLKKIKDRHEHRIEYLVEYWKLHIDNIQLLIEEDLCMPFNVLFKAINKNKDVTTGIKIGHVFVEERYRISFILDRLP